MIVYVPGRGCAPCDNSEICCGPNNCARSGADDQYAPAITVPDAIKNSKIPLGSNEGLRPDTHNTSISYNNDTVI